MPSLQRCGDGVRDKRHFRHQGCWFVRGIILTERCKVVMLAAQQFSNISCRTRQAIVCHCNARTKRSLCAVCSLTDSDRFLCHTLFIRKSETHFQYLAGVDGDAVSQTPEVLINQGIQFILDIGCILISICNQLVYVLFNIFELTIGTPLLSKIRFFIDPSLDILFI